jgi:hypothetical protein
VAVQERCSVTVVLATQQLKAVALQSYSAP